MLVGYGDAAITELYACYCRMYKLAICYVLVVVCTVVAIIMWCTIFMRCRLVETRRKGKERGLFLFLPTMGSYVNGHNNNIDTTMVTTEVSSSDENEVFQSP